MSGEIGAATEWRGGGSVEVTVAVAGGSSTVRGPVAAGQRSFRMVADVADAAATSATVRVRLVPAQGGSPVTDTLTVQLPASGQPSSELIQRRGPATANRDSPAVDLRFRRNEQIVIERSESAEGTTMARLLDRSGAPMNIPLSIDRRVDIQSTAWTSVRLVLAPLAAGDYLIELDGPGGKSLTALRVVP